MFATEYIFSDDGKRDGDDGNNIALITNVILPSDEQWQTKIYYKLVEKQRKNDADEQSMFEPLTPEEPKLYQWNIIPKNKKPNHCQNIVAEAPSAKRLKITNDKAVAWNILDIAKAGALVSKPPLKVEFDDEQEMRRVYTLIYDVFRYKSILTEALNEIAFFDKYPELRVTAFHVWLLLFDLYHRCFKKRETIIALTAKDLFDDVGILKAEQCIWDQRIKLAAAVARLRIRNSALTLNELLPQHLQDGKITNICNNFPVTCWVNGKKIKSMEEAQKIIENSLKLECVNKIEDLGPNNFIFDEICPLTVAFHSTLRPVLAKSRLVRDFCLIVQDKSFCLGPAMFGKILENLELTGNVIQTHINSPRSTAYLANLLSRNEKIRTLMAFSAGGRKGEYEKYFNQLGMNNILIFSDRLIDTTLDNKNMEEVSAVFATPPNSYSAVSDPIDLVCSRGGDLSMLEILTESDITKEGKQRVSQILEEQKKTLKFAMSKPQIQLVLYETHSELKAENQDMVSHSLDEINKIAKLHHAALQGKLIVDNPEYLEINNNENKSNKDLLSFISDEQLLDTISVPDSDIFDLYKLPELCPCDSQCMDFKKEGCFLALLQRKEVIKLDNKYMIKMAENRGLFGQKTHLNAKIKISKTKNREEMNTHREHRHRKFLTEADILRIATPTNAFLCHISKSDRGPICCRCHHHSTTSPSCSMYRNWWKETTRHLTSLKNKLEKENIIPPTTIKQLNTKNVIKSFIPKEETKIDEVLSRLNMTNNIPIFPKLKLRRTCVKLEKTQLELPIINMKFH